MGGGAMRTAAKVAGLRRYRAVPTGTEQAASTRKVSRSIPGIGSTSAVDESKASATLLSTTQNGRVDATDAIQKHNFQETKEAISDIKEALDNMYFSPSLATGGSSVDSEDPVSSEDSVTKICVTNESSAIHPSVPPKHLLNAFALFKERPELQSAVASLASDKNVWEAVMKNEKVKEFYQTHQTTDNLAIQRKADLVVAFARNGYSGFESIGVALEKSTSGFSGFLNYVKLKVINMMSSFTDVFQGIFYTSKETRSAGPKENSNDFVDKAWEASIGLVILVIMVVLLKSL